ncbi:MAG: DNA polymerase III subunit delta' [Alphaproteobacteria bacterium]|nr:DNA polymerase III subunit delta' [Alphaproteobacteria bacterium]
MSEELIELIERPRAETGALIGHTPARHAIAQAYQTGRIAHAWLISGPTGIGKATLAWRMVRLILSASEAGLSPNDIETDPGHPDVRKIIAGAHPDCRLVRRSMTTRSPYRFRTEISVDDIRESTAFLRHTPALSDWRCMIIDAADEMNTNARNALLKVLEEPPPRTVILLVAHIPSRLLPTIRSRCRALPLQTLNNEQVTKVMARSGSDLMPDDMQVVSDISGGSPGRAIHLAQAGGLELYQEVAQLFKTLPGLETEFLHTFSDKFAGAAGEQGYRAFLEILNWLLLREIRNDATTGRGGRRLERWLKAWENISELTTHADNVNLDRKQVVLNTFFELSTAAKSA